MISIKQHKGVLAACDKEILGLVFEEGENRIEVGKRFFAGEKMRKEEFIDLLKSYDNANLVGEETVNCAIKAGIIDKKNVMKIKGVPYAQIYSMQG